MENNNIIKKLQKLLAHKQSAEAIGSLKEAEAFAERIQHLLTQHKLSITDLEAQEEEKEGVASGLAVDPRRFGMKDKDDMIKWLLILAKTIAAVNDCEILVATKPVQNSKAEYRKTGKLFKAQTTNRFLFVGVEVDRVAAEEFYVYMAKLVWEMAGKAGEEQKESFRAEIMSELGKCAPGHLSAKLHNFRHSFCAGFVDAVAKRLKEERERQKAAAKVTETGLMVIDRRALMVRDYLNKNAMTGVSSNFYGAGKMDMGYVIGHNRGQKVALTGKVVEK